MMLPTININNKFTYTIHHTDQVISAQGYMVGQETVLLTELETADLDTSKGVSSVQRAILSLCRECILTPDVDIRTWPNYELEYFLLNCRIHSTGSVIDSKFLCNGVAPKQNDSDMDMTCNEDINVSIDLNDFIIKEYPEYKESFELTDEYTLTLKPVKPLELNTKDGEDAIIKSCLDKLIFNDGNEEVIYNFDDATPTDKDKFIAESISPFVMNSILKNFFNATPSIYNLIETKCGSCNKVHTIKTTSANELFQ